MLSKIGISTIRSYLGAQLFEVLGIGQEVTEKCFTNTISRLGGIGLHEIARESLIRRHAAFNPNFTIDSLETGGYQWRATGETHLFNPNTIH